MGGRVRFGGLSRNERYRYRFGKTRMLLNFDGVDAATTTEDATGKHNSITFNNDAQLDTAEFKFAPSSLLIDGADPNGFVEVGDSQQGFFDISNQDFTIECHMRANTSAGADQVWRLGQVSDNNMSVGLLMSNNNMFMEHTFTGAAPVQTDSGHNALDATWHHMALVRYNDDFDLYMDGVKGSTTVDLAGGIFPLNDPTVNLNIGAIAGTGAAFDGWIDEFRVTISEARYTANFTPPTEPYPSFD